MKRLLKTLFLVFVIISSSIPIVLDLLTRFSDVNLDTYLNEQSLLILVILGTVGGFLLGIILNFKKRFQINSWIELIWKSCVLGSLLLLFVMIIASAPGYSGIVSEYIQSSADSINFALIQVLIISFSYFVAAPLFISLIQVIAKRRKQDLIRFVRTLIFIVAFCGVFVGVGRGIYKFIEIAIKTDFVEIDNNLVVPQQHSNKVIVSHTYGPAFKCLYNESFKYRVLDYLIGNFSAFVRKSVYVNASNCTFIVLDPLYDIQVENNVNKAAVVSEVLIRSFYGKYIVDWKKNTYETVDVISSEEEFFRTNHADGYYIENTIKLKDGIGFMLQTLIHEQLHSFSDVESNIYRSDGAGLEEAMTQLLTNKIMNQVVPTYTSEVYINHLAALQELMKYVDEESLTINYFSNNLWLLERQIDGKTYKGAFCSFNHYLDWAQHKLIIENDIPKAKEMADKAATSLTEDTLSVGYCRY